MTRKVNYFLFDSKQICLMISRNHFEILKLHFSYIELREVADLKTSC